MGPLQALKSSGEVGLMFTITLVLQLVTEAVAKPEKYFTKGYSSRDLPRGGWTQWFNSDHPGGAGDYETVHNVIRRYGQGCDGLPCRHPLAVKVVSTHGLSPAQEGDRVYVSVRQGLKCLSHHQDDLQCANYLIRFYCPRMHRKCRRKWKRRQQENTTPSENSSGIHHHGSGATGHDNDVIVIKDVKSDKEENEVMVDYKRHPLK